MKKRIAAIVLVAAFLAGCGMALMQDGMAAGSEVPVVLNVAKAAVSMQPFDLVNVDNYRFIEDAGGTMHMIYIEYGTESFLCHRYLGGDGVWSAPERFADDGRRIFHALLTPDGELCVVWVGLVSDGSYGLKDALFTAYYRNGGFEHAPAVEYASDGKALSINGIEAVYIDRQGAIRCMYYCNDSEGYFLSERQLTLCDWDRPQGEMDVPVAEGLSHWGAFFADSQGVCHIFDIVGGDGMAEQSLIHSYSKDNGATWEGPYTVLEGLTDFYYAVSCDEDGNIRLIITQNRYGLYPQPHLLLCTLKAGTYEPISLETYLEEEEMDGVAYPGGEVDYALTGFADSIFYSADYGPDGSLRLIGQSGWDYYAFERKADGAWDIRKLTAPDDVKSESITPCKIQFVFFRRNGGLFAVGSHVDHGPPPKGYLDWGEVGW